MKIYEIGTGYTPIPAQIAAATESVVEELTKAFMKMGQPVEIIDIAAKERASHHLPITEVKIPSFLSKKDVGLGILHKLKRVIYSIALSFRLKNILKAAENEKIVLHFHNQYNLFFFLRLVSSKLRSRAVIAYTNHNGLWSLPINETESILKKRYFQEIYAMKRANIVFVLNNRMRENIVSYLRIPSDRVVQINNGVNTEIYCPLSVEERKKAKADLGVAGKNVILQVGSVNENKGQERSVRLMAPLLKENPALIFAYAGEVVSQEYQELVKKTAEELGVAEQVLYLGAFSPGKEMNRIYNIATATLFVSRYEGFALVCVESLSSGVPVVLCSDLQLDLGDGCFKSQLDDFAETVRNVLFLERDDAHTDSRNNAVENYSWDCIAHGYICKMKR